MNRDEILALRKPSSILPEMVDKLPVETISMQALEPESFKPMDERAIYRIWHDQPRKGGGGAPGRPGQGRGRGGGSPSLGAVQSREQGRWGGSPGSGPSAPGGLGGQMPNLGLNTNQQAGWRRGMGANGNQAIPPNVGNVLGGATSTWGKKPTKEVTGTGGFFLGAQSDQGNENGSWTRGMKLEETEDKLEDDEAGFFGDNDDDNLDLAGLSSAALQFEMEKQKMQYDSNASPSSSVNATFASLFGTSEGASVEQPVEVRPPSPPAQVPVPASVPAPSSSSQNKASDVWHYLDPNGLVQGPFKGEQMKMWHKLRYFESTPHLPVRNGQVGEFIPLSSLPHAFEEYDNLNENRTSSSETSNVTNQRQIQQENQRKQQQLERERQLQEERERHEEMERNKFEQQRLERENEERANRDRELQMKRWEMERDAKHEAEEERRRLQKAALDALMEKQAADERAEQLHRQQLANRKANESAAAAAANQGGDLPESEQSKKVWGSGKGGGSANLADIQQEEQSATAARTESDQLKQMLGMGGMASPGGGSVWGGAAASSSSNTKSVSVDKAGQGAAKSLLDIQAEEQRAAALRKKTEPPKSAGGHWAALASNAPAPSAKGVWGPGRAPPAPAPRATQPPVSTAPEVTSILNRGNSSQQQQQSTQSDGWEEASGGKKRSGQQAPVQQNSQQMQQPTQTKDSKAFGGPSLGSGLNGWCEDQLKRLTGSADMTLIHFCMSLDDPAEIRSYLSAYLVKKNTLFKIYTHISSLFYLSFLPHLFLTFSFCCISRL